MLMFIFGAGASFDSDPMRRPDDPEVLEFENEHRPPLAAGLFNPGSRKGKEDVALFPRARSLIMQLRQATAQGLDVEEVLEQVASDETYPNTAVQLLAFRGYLSHLLTDVPAEWLDECQGLTNYVAALEKAHRWNVAIHPESRDPFACVTFNYDALIEDAVQGVFGQDLMNDMNAYAGFDDVHVFKPHGSVSWRTPATWDLGTGHWCEGFQGLTRAIDQASALVWDETDTWRCNLDNDTYQDEADTTKVWLPALSVPVRHKTSFSMPEWHMDALIADLQKVTTMIAVGWRARENHFLQLLQEHLPSKPARLVAVAESDDAARETIDNLWKTGRFGSYAFSGVGFSGFAETPTGPFVADRSWTEGHTPLTLDHVLSAAPGMMGVWTTMAPGAGLAREREDLPYLDPGYVEL